MQIIKARSAHVKRKGNLVIILMNEHFLPLLYQPPNSLNEATRG